jgi:serine/threonine-protein phosphatase 2B catalytic subunit
MPDIDFLWSHFIHEGRLTEEQALFIIKTGTDVLRQEPTMLEIDEHITGIQYGILCF